jgi:hypothetical protein
MSSLPEPRVRPAASGRRFSKVQKALRFRGMVSFRAHPDDAIRAASRLETRWKALRAGGRTQFFAEKRVNKGPRLHGNRMLDSRRVSAHLGSPVQ